MKLNKFARKLICFLLCGIIVSFGIVDKGLGFVGAVTQSEINELKEQQETLEREETELNNELQKARENINDQKKIYATIQKKIDVVQKQIDVLLKSINELNIKIAEKEAEISGVEAEIDEDKEALRKRIKSLYLAGDTSTVEIILGAKSFQDLMDKTYLIQLMGEKDAKIVDKLNKKIDSISTEKNEIEDTRKNLLEQKSEVESKKSELDELEFECVEILNNLEMSKEELETKLSLNEQNRLSLADELSEKEKEYYNQMNQSTPSWNGSGIISNSGNYAWPAPECPIITSYWGDGRNHKGMDFACAGSAYGKAIVAAESGTVTIANNTDSWGYGWGYYINISHGGGYSTQYAHCSQVLVSVGQYVEKGQLIGYIGNTGNSFGAHLHFECWYNGVRYDPATELGL